MNFRLLALAILAIAPLPGFSGSACVDGTADGFQCQNVDLVARMPNAEMNLNSLSDIWGWTASDGTEYALVGGYEGTAFVRLNADDTLTYLGTLPDSEGRASATKPVAKSCSDDECGQSSTWRDIKVYGDYAYIVSEAPQHGLQIFDLTQLESASEGQAWTEADYTFHGDFGHAHNIFINEDSARAYVVGNSGSTPSNGGLIILDISNPTSPNLVGIASSDGYTHDVQCVVYSGPDTTHTGDEICFASNEDTLTIWDVTNPSAPAMLSRTSYTGSQYTHQAWLSEDQAYIFLNDELDEGRTGTRTHLRVFNIGVLASPQFARSYLAPTLAIDHNNYTYGRWLYQTNYTAGFRILDVDDPAYPVQAAYFDTMASEATTFDGTWSNFAFPSGRVVLSDIAGGLFVVRPTIAAANGSDLEVSITTGVQAQEEGNATPGFELRVDNTGTSAATDVRITAHLPRNFAFAGPSDTSSCSSLGRVIECRVGDIPAGGSWVDTAAILEGNFGSPEGYFMAYGAETDPTPANNLAKQTFTIAAPASSSGSGGGGGSLAWLLLFPLLGFRRRRM